jgi:hypothetical protein
MHCMGGWVGPGVFMDTMVNWKISISIRNQILILQLCSSQPAHYNQWFTPLKFLHMHDKIEHGDGDKNMICVAVVLQGAAEIVN